MGQIYIGRQPILDRSSATVGYELLFRADQHAATASIVDGDAATSTVLTNAISEIGLDNLVGERLAFINMTEHFLRNPDLLECLPPERVVLEILETVNFTDDVIRGVERLIDNGYTLALDDFEHSRAAEPLLDQVQIVKYDYTVTRPEQLAELAQKDRDAGRKVLVERIETLDEFNTASAMAVDYFQGYYFAKPTTLKQTGIPSNKTTLLELMATVCSPSATLEEIADLVTHDVGLSVKVLRYVNSAGSSCSTKIESITHASVLLGRKRLRSWVSIMLMANINEKPIELTSLALYRAKFCELLAEEQNLEPSESYFTVGMLSLLDVMTDTSFDEILQKLSLGRDVHSTLCGEPGPMLDILNKARALGGVDAGLEIDASPAVLDAHLSAMQWANALMGTLHK